MNSELSRRDSGQALLITVMLVAVVLTVVFTLSFTSRTDQQITKLEEENQKALAAAEAGIEAQINQHVGTSTTLQQINPSLFGQITGNVDVTGVTGPTFLSPNLLTNQQFTFYLVDYNDGSFKKNSGYNGKVAIGYGYGPVGTDCRNIALEITVISGNALYTINRWIADTGDKLGSNTNDIQTGSPTTIANQSFACGTTQIDLTAGNPNNITSPKFLLVRLLYAPNSIIGFSGTVDFNSQGKYVKSTATTPSGVSKTVQLYQSYPQLPSDFFVTSSN